MTRYIILVLGFSFLAEAAPPALELELDSRDYQLLLEQRVRNGEIQKHVLSPVMEMGKRNLDWLKFINDHRGPENKISFSSPANQPAYPVDSPRVSNPTLILEEYSVIKSEIPSWYRAILFEGAPFLENPPVSDSQYITLGMRIDFNYQRASRWILEEPYLAEYTQEKSSDVRGYYYFNQDLTHKENLKRWESLSKIDQAKYSSWLTGLCLNMPGETDSSCDSKLAETLKKDHHPVAFFTQYFPAGQKKWDHFFSLGVKRPDVVWNSQNPNLMKVAFLEPANGSEIKSFLIDNIEDEWRWGKWQLQLDFKPAGNFPLIVFEAGATPHVNDLGGNTITMDANQPLTEYNVRWTIRHEYGHVIGFPDCYVEFYDKSQAAMISYQLDISNLMCSRRGHLKETHYTELKKVYLPAQAH